MALKEDRLSHCRVSLQLIESDGKCFIQSMKEEILMRMRAEHLNVANLMAFQDKILRARASVLSSFNPFPSIPLELDLSEFL